MEPEEERRRAGFGRNTRSLFRFWRGSPRQTPPARVEPRRLQNNPILPNVLERAQLRPTDVIREVVNEYINDEDIVNTLAVLNQNQPQNENEMSAETIDPLVGFHSLLLGWLYHSENQRFDEFWDGMEQKTLMKRETLSYLCLGFLTLSLVLGNLSEVVGSLFGVLYPSICTYEMLKMNPSEVPELLRRHWLCYWSIYGFVTSLDFVGRPVFGFLPFFSLAKAAFLFAVALPDFQLSEKVYNVSVKPTLKATLGIIKKYVVF